MPQFLFRLIPPRPSFPFDMSEAEQAKMGAHSGYWADLQDRGTCLIYGPVLDPEGPWGLAIVDTETPEDADAIFAGDPVVVAGICTWKSAPIMVARRDGKS